MAEKPKETKPPPRKPKRVPTHPQKSQKSIGNKKTSKRG